MAFATRAENRAYALGCKKIEGEWNAYMAKNPASNPLKFKDLREELRALTDERLTG